MQWSYLLALVLSLVGLGLLDWRYKLVLWHDLRRAMLCLSIGLAVFLAWDFAAIASGIFLHGGSPYALPYTLLPQFPVEEIVFLLLLCYNALILYTGASRRWPRT